MNPVGQRRASPRSRTLLDGHIVYNNGLTRMACTVRDLSETGARLVFALPVKVPAEFELQIPRKKLVQRAQIIWYDGQNHGIMFLDKAESPASDAASGMQEATKPLTLGQDALGVSAVLDEARRRIARLLGVSADAIQLKVEFDK
jgi:hypothetical protein